MEHVWQYLNARQGVLFLHDNVGPPILPVHWVAPEQSGDYYFHLRITDGKSSVEDSISVHVMDTIGSFVDPRDNHEYKWVKIGSQIWMAENLAYLPTVSSSYTGSVLEKHYYVYGYEGTDVEFAKTTDNYRRYGVLYNWPAAMNGKGSSHTVPSGVQGVCPDGWHLPSLDEFDPLLSHYVSWHDNLRSTEDWELRNGTNSTGFNAFPGGYRETYGTETYFQSLHVVAYFWTATRTKSQGTNNQNTARILDLDVAGVIGGHSPYSQFNEGLSVRCVKDE